MTPWTVVAILKAPPLHPVLHSRRAGGPALPIKTDPDLGADLLPTSKA